MRPAAQCMSCSTPSRSSGASTPRYRCIRSVPLLGELVEVDIAADQLLLELEPQDDVQVVRGLVGLDADERGLDPFTTQTTPRARRRRAPPGSAPADCGKKKLPELAAAPDEVLPQAALRLVQAERRPARERRALQVAGDAVLVQPVAAFVHRGEEAVEVRRRGSASSAGCPRCRCESRTGARSGRAARSSVVEAEALEHGQLEAASAAPAGSCDRVPVGRRCATHPSRAAICSSFSRSKTAAPRPSSSRARSRRAAASYGSA